MRRDEVGYQLVGEPLRTADAAEIGVELFEKGERRLAHQPQHPLFGVLRRHFEPPRRVVLQHRLQVGRIVEEVVADAAADKGLFDAFHGPYLGIEVEQRAVVVVQIGALLRMQTRGPAAFAAQLAVAAAHAVHVGRGRPHVGQIALEPRHLRHPLHLGQYRAFAARVDELALVGRDGAERAAPEAAAVDVH